MLNWLLKRFRRRPCMHRANYIAQTWNASDGTPMQKMVCLDCGFTDEGHVYGDLNDPAWPAYIRVVNGVVIEDTRVPKPHVTPPRTPAQPSSPRASATGE